MNVSKIYKTSFHTPAFIIYTLFFVVPCLLGFGYALTNWNSMTDNVRFIGLDNFKVIFSTSGQEYLKFIWNTIYFTVFAAVGELIIGVLLALLLNNSFKSRNLLRAIFFLPQTIAPLIIGLIFSSILAPSGIVNYLLELIGLEVLTRSWLTDIHTAMPSVISVEIWRWVGLNMVIFLAGLQVIPKSYYEAAAIDGANGWDQFISITLPHLMPAITINAVLNTIHGLKVFDIIFSLTNGGPGTITQVLSTAVYSEYGSGHYGLSTALSLVMFLLTTVIACTLQGVISRKEVDY